MNTTAWTLFKCLPFFGFAGIGVYMLCVSFFPSWRQPGWRHWKSYVGYGDTNPSSLSEALGFTKSPKPIAEGDWSEETGRRFYLWVGMIVLVIAFIGIRHFAEVPQAIPDVLGSLPR